MARSMFSSVKNPEENNISSVIIGSLTYRRYQSLHDRSLTENITSSNAAIFIHYIHWALQTL